MFAVRLSNKAEKQFKELDGKMQARAIKLFKTLENNPVPREQYNLLKVVRIAKIERRTETTYK